MGFGRRENILARQWPAQHAYWSVCSQERDRDAAELHRAMQSARESACCGRPSRKCTAQDFAALIWMPFWPKPA